MQRGEACRCDDAERGLLLPGRSTLIFPFPPRHHPAQILRTSRRTYSQPAEEHARQLTCSVGRAPQTAASLTICRRFNRFYTRAAHDYSPSLQITFFSYFMAARDTDARNDYHFMPRCGVAPHSASIAPAGIMRSSSRR